MHNFIFLATKFHDVVWNVFKYSKNMYSNFAHVLKKKS